LLLLPERDRPARRARRLRQRRHELRRPVAARRRALRV
jgi:hypothetical protein